jgi:biopolymer transport protein ExbB
MMKLPDTTETWAMVLTLLPIFLCSIVGSAITVAKWVQLHRSRRAGEHVFAEVGPLIGAHDFARVLPVTRDNRSHVARLIERTVAAANLPSDRLNKHIEQAGRELARELERGLDAIGLITTLAPLLGLFGTVVGIVLIFQKLNASQGVVSPHELAGGIGTALYTTIVGLIVGMCALVSHRYLLGLADSAIDQLEAVGLALQELIQEGRS